MLDDAQKHPARQKFVQLALADTDRRVAESKPVAPSFMLACMLWHEVLDRWLRLKKGGEAPFPALQQAIDAVFDARIGDISGRGKLAGDMREIWLMQPRFERRTGNGPFTLVEQPRFRAAFDFLRLRADAGEIETELARWWEDFSLADPDERHRLMQGKREGARDGPRDGPRDAPRRSSGPRAAPATRDAAPAKQAEAAEADDAGDATDGDLSAEPARKRRRRRRKPGGGEGAGGAAPASGGDAGE
jgi:poly(A) polymerase